MALSRRRTEMASKKHRPEEALAELRQVDVLVSQGQSVAEAIRAIGVAEVAYCRWRRGVGGLKSGQGKRAKGLGAENPRLRRALPGPAPGNRRGAGGGRGEIFGVGVS